MRITLRVWRQKSRDDEGRMVTYELDDVNENMSFLEMLDVLNEKLTLQGDLTNVLQKAHAKINKKNAKSSPNGNM